jgi:hypothetical protein
MLFVQTCVCRMPLQVYLCFHLHSRSGILCSLYGFCLYYHAVLQFDNISHACEAEFKTHCTFISQIVEILDSSFGLELRLAWGCLCISVGMFVSCQQKVQ